MNSLNEYQIKLVSGAVSVRDAASAAGTIIGGIAGSATRIPKGELIGGAVGGFVGGYIYDNSQKTITIPPNIIIDPVRNGSPWGQPNLPKLPFCR